VRDGIISHCGEVDQNGLRPREELIDLKLFTEAGQYQPATWEGCVVKISDKIAYVGRDIEDAINLGFLDISAQEKLLKMARLYDQKVMNSTVIMYNMIIDICNSSSPENGISLSKTFLEQINEIKNFNYNHIYGNKRLSPYMHYSELVITEIFNVLLDCYDEKHTFTALETQLQYSPILLASFKKWLCRYCESDFIPNQYIDRDRIYDNDKIYGRLENKKIYVQAIIDYISGMTDHFAIDVFNELITY
jgi:dGTPase